MSLDRMLVQMFGNYKTMRALNQAIKNSSGLTKRLLISERTQVQQTRPTQILDEQSADQATGAGRGTGG